MEHNSIKLFGSRQIRTSWDEQQEKWYFSVVDVVEALTDSVNPADYLKKMRKREPELAKGWGQIVTPLDYQTAGGRQKINFADTEGILRIIQSIPSPKAEPFKRWMAKVAREELEAQTGRQVVSPMSAKRFFEGQNPTLPINDEEENPDNEPTDIKPTDSL